MTLFRYSSFAQRRKSVVRHSMLSFSSGYAKITVILCELRFLIYFQGLAVPTSYPGWVLGIAAVIIFAGIAPIPIVFLLRRFQCVKLDVDIHQGSIRRIDTTVSTKEMMGDVDVSRFRRPRSVVDTYLHVETLSCGCWRICGKGREMSVKIASWLVVVR